MVSTQFCASDVEAKGLRFFLMRFRARSLARAFGRWVSWCWWVGGLAGWLANWAVGWLVGSTVANEEQEKVD